MDLFKEVIPSILETKNHLISSEDEEREYNAFIVNKALSQHIDTIFYVNEMNLNHHLDNKLQYDFLYHSLKGYKRKYQKWLKYKETKEEEIVCKYYNCSRIKAKTYLSILTQEQLKQMEDKLDIGGKVSNTNK